MNKTGVIALIACILIGSAEAMFIKLSEEELIEQSGLIVVGELIGRSQVSLATQERPQLLGVIRVEEVLKGARATAVAFLALPGGKIMASSDLTYTDGQNGLWYLRLRNADVEGVYVADHPQSFVPMEQADERVTELRALKL